MFNFFFKDFVIEFILSETFNSSMQLEHINAKTRKGHCSSLGTGDQNKLCSWKNSLQWSPLSANLVPNRFCANHGRTWGWLWTQDCWDESLFLRSLYMKYF